MKKLFLIYILYISIWYTHWIDVVYDSPTFGDFEPATVYNNVNANISEARLVDYIQDPFNTDPDVMFCEELGYTFVESSQLQQWQQLGVETLYTYNGEWYEYRNTFSQFIPYDSVTCDDWTVEPWTWTGSTLTGSIVINNINNDPWINKEIFNEETINEIYQYEALIMVFLILFRFFDRLLWRKSKMKNSIIW